MSPSYLTMLRTDYPDGRVEIRPDYSRGVPMLFFVEPEIRQLVPSGFYMVYRPEWSFNYVYAIWWLWPWYKAYQKSKDGYWFGLRWLYHKGLIHTTTDRNEVIRFRNLRLGRGNRP